MCVMGGRGAEMLETQHFQQKKVGAIKKHNIIS